MWEHLFKYDVLDFVLCDIIGFVDITLWISWDWCNFWQIPLFEELLGEYLCILAKNDAVIFALGIIGIYIHQIHQLVLSLICVPERVTILDMGQMYVLV